MVGISRICKEITYNLTKTTQLKMGKGPWLVWLSGLSTGCESKGCWFDSQSGHMPALWASPSLSPSIPLSLKINNLKKKKKKE